MLSLRRADQLATGFQNKLQALPVDNLARQSGFVKRKPQKITPSNFLIGFFILVLSGASSLTAFAITLGLIAGCTISKQAIDQRIQAPVIKFFEFILAACLFEDIKRANKALASHTRSLFNRILVEDSTSIQLPSKLVKFFPGSKNGKNKETAMLKVKATMDLLSEKFVRFFISPFTHNDQSAASDIFVILQAGDFLIRDLGFFVLSVFRRIQLRGAFYLSHLKYGVTLYETDGKTKIDLLRLLKKHDRLDRKICLGAQEKLPVRLVAIPLSEEQAAKRRREYKANRDRRLNPSKEHLVLLGWDIFITNVPSEYLSADQIAQIYDLRWRIEIIFKSWKSHFHITNVPNANVIRVRAYIYAMLLFITIFQANVWVRLYKENLEKNEKQLSLLKVAQFFNEHLWAIILFFHQVDKLEQQISYHCTYENRKDRVNYASQAQMALSLA